MMVVMTGESSHVSVKARTPPTERWRLRWANLRTNWMVNVMPTKAAVRRTCHGRLKPRWTRRGMPQWRRRMSEESLAKR